MKIVINVYSVEYLFPFEGSFQGECGYLIFLSFTLLGL